MTRLIREDIPYFLHALPNIKLRNISSCLVIQVGNTIQIIKNRDGYKTWDEIKNLEFIMLTKADIPKYPDRCMRYYGKNVWYIAE